MVYGEKTEMCMLRGQECERMDGACRVMCPHWRWWWVHISLFIVSKAFFPAATKAILLLHSYSRAEQGNAHKPTHTHTHTLTHIVLPGRLRIFRSSVECVFVLFLLQVYKWSEFHWVWKWISTGCWWIYVCMCSRSYFPILNWFIKRFFCCCCCMHNTHLDFIPGDSLDRSVFFCSSLYCMIIFLSFHIHAYHFL